jgi:hypothetical protein
MIFIDMTQVGRKYLCYLSYSFIMTAVYKKIEKLRIKAVNVLDSLKMSRRQDSNMPNTCTDFSKTNKLGNDACSGIMSQVRIYR